MDYFNQKEQAGEPAVQAPTDEQFNELLLAIAEKIAEALAIVEQERFKYGNGAFRGNERSGERSGEPVGEPMSEPNREQNSERKRDQ